MLNVIRRSLVFLVVATAITGVAYPLVITGMAHALFPEQASGSLIDEDGNHVGSVVLGQAFSGSGYFWSRPSMTGDIPYDGLGSDASNLTPTAIPLRIVMAERAAALREMDGQDREARVPVDLVTASASGLDPHISIAGARYQAARIAGARGLGEEEVLNLIDRHTEERLLGVFGERVVHVVQLNLALDRLTRNRNASNGIDM